jgi:lysophospholipase L1-like esterase
MQHVVLVGDSILDNGAYVAPQGEVLAKLTSRMPAGHEATLLARDGAVIDGIRLQLARIPNNATNLVISAGGNDAMRSTGIFMERASIVADALAKVLTIRDAFADAYRGLLDEVQSLGLPVAICTIYDVLLPNPEQRRVANLALGVLNDVITREAASRRLPLIDLRVMFTREEYFANAIEPSEKGSELIAAAVVQALAHDYSGPSAIYTGA